MEQDENKSISFDISHETARGTYSNLAIVTNSNIEFVIDFAHMLPGMPKPEVTNRIIMTPDNAKRLLRALNNNIQQYEEHFGRITSEYNEGMTFNMEDISKGGAKS